MSNDTAIVKRDDAMRLPRPINTAAINVVTHIQRVLPALPSHIPPQQFAHAAVIAANELKQDCNPISVLTAAMNCAKMGLMPGSALGLAYFVPFKGDCQLIVGYKGFVDLGYRNGFLKIVLSEIVCNGEQFERWNDENGAHFRHPLPIDRQITRDNMVCAYAWGELSTGGKFFKSVSGDEIRKLADAQIARSKGFTPWKDQHGFVEMALKTPLRRAAKLWKLTPELAMAVRLDEQAERGDPQDALSEADGAAPVNDKAGFDDFGGGDNTSRDDTPDNGKRDTFVEDIAGVIPDDDQIPY